MDYNISTSFKSINQKRLKNTLKKNIKDSRFWDEISKILNAGGVYELQLIFEYKRVFHPSILSPFLYNIYMHEFDERVIRLQKLMKNSYKSFDSGIYKVQEMGKSYCNGTSAFIQHNLKTFLQNDESNKGFREVRKMVFKKHCQVYERCKEASCLQYVRYLYDFLIGIAGSRKYAVQIRKDLNKFIKSDLHLEVKKDSIVHRSEKSIKFLDHLISFREYELKTSVVPKSIRAIQKNKNKSITQFLENDKRLAKSKSYQFYSNVLKQFNILSSKLNISVSDKSHVNVLASIIAYKYIGLQLMKKMPVNS
jgi:hypothetical protein